MDELLTVTEVSERLKVNEQTVRNWIDRGELPSVRVGERRVRVSVAALETYLGGASDASTAGSRTPEPPARPPAAAPTDRGLQRGQIRQLERTIDSMLSIATDLTPGTFLQRELAECIGRLQVALRAAKTTI